VFRLSSSYPILDDAGSTQNQLRLTISHDGTPLEISDLQTILSLLQGNPDVTITIGTSEGEISIPCHESSSIIEFPE